MLTDYLTTKPTLTVSDHQTDAFTLYFVPVDPMLASRALKRRIDQLSITDVLAERRKAFLAQEEKDFHAMVKEMGEEKALTEAGRNARREKRQERKGKGRRPQVLAAPIEVAA